MTQAERLIIHFKTHRTIDPMQAWKELGIYRLGARIWDLKKQGYNITMSMTTVLNQFGERCRIACYEIERKV